MTIQNNEHPAGQPAGPDALDFLRSSVSAHAMMHGRGGHEAGGTIPGFENWRPALMSADAASLPDIGPAKSRARDLVRNSAFARNAKRINRDNVVGPGLRLSLAPDHVLLGIDKDVSRDWGRKVQRRWNVYANGRGHHADVRRIRSFNQLLQTMADTLFEDGEALAVRTWRAPRSGHSAGTAFQLVNPDRLSNPDGVADRPGLRSGVYTNRYGEPTHYAIREVHPSDGQFGEYKKLYRWKKIRREGATGTALVMHIFDHDHAEMTRGMTDFVTAIKPLKMLQKYKDTTLERAIIQAIFAATIKTEMNYSDAMTAMGQGFMQETMSARKNPVTAMTVDHMQQVAGYHKKSSTGFGGAQLNHLLPNEDLVMHRAEGADSNFEGFEKAVLREIAAGTGTPITALSQNYADVNYSAARASLLDVWRHYMAKRDLLVDGFCWPAFAAWLEEEVISGAIKLPEGVSDFYEARDALLVGRWYGVGKPMIDPLKERKAQKEALELGVETAQSIAANEGHDWEDLAEQKEREDLDALERRARLQTRAQMLGLDIEPVRDVSAKPDKPKSPIGDNENE